MFTNVPRLLPPGSVVGNGVEAADARKVVAAQSRLPANTKGLPYLSK
jgi:hypothetical protein